MNNKQQREKVMKKGDKVKYDGEKHMVVNILED